MANADETTVIHALDALASLGPAAVPRLIEALKFEKARGGIVHLLGRIGPAASAATPALVKLIDDKNERLAKESILALAKIGPGAKEAVPALVDLLKQEGCVNTHAIVYALGKIGPDAASAQPVLVELLKNTDENLVLESAWALANIEPQSAEIAAKTLPILTAGLTNSSPLIRVGAAEALGNLGVLATEAIPALQKVMNDNDKAVRDAAAKAVHQIRGASSK